MLERYIIFGFDILKFLKIFTSFKRNKMRPYTFSNKTLNGKIYLNCAIQTHKNNR